MAVSFLFSEVPLAAVPLGTLWLFRTSVGHALDFLRPGLGALHVAQLEAHRMRDLAPALAVRALLQHAGKRGLQLLGSRLRDALLLQRGFGERERVVDVAVAHLLEPWVEAPVAQFRYEDLGVVLRAGENGVALRQRVGVLRQG